MLGSGGLGSSCPGDVTAAQLALGSVMLTAPGACMDPLLAGLSSWLDRAEHGALTDDDIAVYRTPEGILSSEVVPEGVYVPEVVVNKNVRKARGRMRVRARGHACRTACLGYDGSLGCIASSCDARGVCCGCVLNNMKLGSCSRPHFWGCKVHST